MNREIPELDKKALRNFSWMFAVVVVSLFGLIFPWLFKRDWPWEPWVIAAAFFTWGVIAPSAVRPFYRLWMRFGFVMNAIVTRIILGAVYYFVILPFGLVFRLRGRDSLRRKLDQELHSYRIKSNIARPMDMKRPF